MRSLLLSLFLLVGCGQSASHEDLPPTLPPTPPSSPCDDMISFDRITSETPEVTPGYPGAATFSQPDGFDNFVTLGADPSGAVNAEPVLRSWYDNGGTRLFIPAGTYKLEYTNTTKRGVVLGRSIQVIGAGEGVVTLNMGPDDPSFSTCIFEIASAVDFTLKGVHVVGNLMSGQIPFEQIQSCILFGNTVVSATPTNVVIDHVTWDRMIEGFMFFGGSTTPTTFMLSNFEGRAYHDSVNFYRDYSANHQMILRTGSFLRWAITPAQNPYSAVAAGVAVYLHGNINFRMEGVLFDNAENPTVHRLALKCGGSSDRLLSVNQQVLIDCVFADDSGAMLLDGWSRVTLFRCSILNETDGTLHSLGGIGVDFVECDFRTAGLLCAGGKTYNFLNCSFPKCAIRVAEANTIVNIQGGSTHWAAGDVSPGYIVRCDQNASSVINVCDHDFWSEITDNGGNTYLMYMEGGSLNLSRVRFRGAWRNGADNAPIQIFQNSNVGQVVLDRCVFDLGAKYAAKVGGPNGKTTLLTLGTVWGGALVSDPYGEWAGS